MSIKKLFAAALVCAASVSVAFGQTTAKYPLQSISYPHGYKPASVDTTKLKTWYDGWKSGHLVTTCTNKGIMATADDHNQVKVEGVGWALITTAYMGDKANFDGIYRFYNASSNLTPNSGGMMSWLVDCNGIYQNNSNNEGTATDGDLDVAFGLIVASWQWGGSYLDSARSVIGRVRQLITTCDTLGTNLSVIAGGYNGGVWGGACNYTDISYYTPAFFRVFAEVSGDQAWNKLADDTYTHLERNAHGTTGLVSDWQSVMDGAPFLRNGGDSNKDEYYSYDACRTPWRISLDYLWNGNERAKAWATKISGWAHGHGISNLRDGHRLDGTSSPGSSGSAGMAFLGALAVGAMTNSQTIVNDFGTAVNNASTSHWYQRYLGNVYLLALTGNMWREDLVLPTGVKLNVVIDGKGFVKRSPDKYLYAKDETVTLTAAPDLGYTFEGWTGEGSGGSKEAAITVTMSAARNITAKFSLSSGVNFVKNGDFSQGAGGMQDWTLNQGSNYGNSSASSSTANGSITINITTLPTSGNNWDIQLVQPSLPLLKGNTYVVTFEASAAANRTMEVMSQLAASPWTSYFSETIELTTTKQTFSFEFEMDKNDDLNARLGFNLGNNLANVTIGNISVMFASGGTSIRTAATQPVKKSGMTVTAKSRNAIDVRFNARSSGATELRLYGLRGDLITKTVLQTVAGRSYTHTLNTGKIPRGFYVVTVNSNGAVIEHSRVMLSK
ncbi:MAG: glycosyl hydrolase family 8 [Chitinispirillia bacterium]|nr:glycosyl hydrolase family 8 [Chitinispirillia bacterium]MCL2268148.1 glycosyl hydrolase family 8 [Chitinispirillia bacterium]